MTTEFNVLALIKGKERYVFIYDDASRESLVEVLHDQAADPELSLNWFDVVVLTKKAEEQCGEKSAIEMTKPARF